MSKASWLYPYFAFDEKCCRSKNGKNSQIQQLWGTPDFDWKIIQSDSQNIATFTSQEGIFVSWHKQPGEALRQGDHSTATIQPQPSSDSTQKSLSLAFHYRLYHLGINHVHVRQYFWVVRRGEQLKVKRFCNTCQESNKLATKIMVPLPKELLESYPSTLFPYCNSGTLVKRLKWYPDSRMPENYVILETFSCKYVFANDIKKHKFADKILMWA